MRLQPPNTVPERIGFLLLPRFAMVAFFSAIEPLRIANRIAGRPLFEWDLISRDGEPVIASNGMTLAVNSSLHAAQKVPSLAVCASFDPESCIDDELIDWLRACDLEGCVLGGMDTGCYALAAAGLLNDKTVTLHWECLSDFHAHFPGVDVVESIYEVTEEGFSCAGGSAAIDMSLDLIRRRHGDVLAKQVRDQLIHEQGRRPASRQRNPAIPQEPMIQRAITLMDTNLESPLSIRTLANELGISWRRLDRLFSRHLAMSPQQTYLARRLDNAYRLLSETPHSIMDISLATGFASASSFSRAFRHHYGSTPSQLRQQAVSNHA